MDLKISLNTLNKLLQYKCYNFDKIISGGNKFGINTKVHGTRIPILGWHDFEKS